VPARTRVVAAGVVATLALVGMIVVVARLRADRSGVAHLSFATSTRASAPFEAFSEAHVAVGTKCLRVLVASEPGQRTQGLRDVTSLSPYAGMLFVNPGTTNARYTMANTPMPLDITFFAASGAPVDSTQMTPCPAGSDATCPEYESKSAYRYALERPTGSSGSGSLGACV
jgi:uncharacterized membrane protein (UPF0127 family)